VSTLPMNNVGLLARLACVVVLSASVAPASAAEMLWRTQKVAYAAIEPKDLRVFLREFAAQQGVGLFLDPEVKGELTGRYDLTPRSMMELLGRTFGLIWYFDGRVLHVYPSTAVESGVVQLAEASPAQFRRTLDRLGISDSRYPLSFDADRGTALVSGPKRFVELVRQAASASDHADAAIDPNTELRVFTLSYGFADDYQVTSGGREYRVPGVVNILRQAFASDSQGGGAPSTRSTSVTARKPIDLNATGDTLLPLLGSLRDEPGGAERRRGKAPNGLPSFAADSRTNAVIVRDTAARIGRYEAVIRRLDEKPKLVELEANIIEVNSDDFSALGIDWRALGQRGSIEVGGGGIANAVTQPPGASPAVGGDVLQSLGNVAGTVLGVITGNRTQLFARIAALEKAGKASVSAQPRVMTLNNVEAALDATSTFYVPVQGFQDAKLFDVSAGTSIRITPSVVRETRSGKTAAADTSSELVRMLIKIEDGGFTAQQVGTLPVVQRTTINTQSMVAEGSTLLIAGYAQERESQNRTGVPGLSKVPVLGGLFRSTDKSRTRVERLFMITPRVVSVQANEVAKPLQLLPSATEPPAKVVAKADVPPSPPASPLAAKWWERAPAPVAQPSPPAEPAVPASMCRPRRDPRC
jgi:type III secretion protein C